MAAQSKQIAQPNLSVVDANTDPLSKILEILARDGGVIVHNMLTSDVVTRLKNELDPTTEATQVSPKTEHRTVNYFW